MRALPIIVAATCMLFVPAAALAQDGTEGEAGTEAKKVKNADKMRCKRIQVTGSLIKKRLCRTNAEWAEIARSGNRAARTLVDHANQGTTSGR